MSYGCVIRIPVEAVPPPCVRRVVTVILAMRNRINRETIYAMENKRFYWLIASYLYISFPLVMAQDIEVPLSFIFSGVTPFQNVTHSIGMDSTAFADIDTFDEDGLIPPINFGNFAVFRIENFSSFRDFRPISRRATWVLELHFSDPLETITMQWDHTIFQSGGSVFQAATSSLGTDFSKVEVRDISNGTVIVDLRNPTNEQIKGPNLSELVFNGVESGAKLSPFFGHGVISNRDGRIQT